MNAQTQKLIIALVPVLISMFAGGYFVASWRFNLKTSLELGTEVNVPQGKKTPTPTPTPSPVSTPSPAATPTPQIQKEFVNLTGVWISERSTKKYFVGEDNNSIRMYESDENLRRLLVGEGTRRGNQIIIAFHSTLDEVDGTLTLNIAEDGKSMAGRFTALGDPTKEAEIRMLRTN